MQTEVPQSGMHKGLTIKWGRRWSNPSKNKNFEDGGNNLEDSFDFFLMELKISTIIVIFEYFDMQCCNVFQVF